MKINSGKIPEVFGFKKPRFSLPSLPTNYVLEIASFRLHLVWGTNPDNPVVSITEVLPLPPSRTIGNVGGKHRSQATQLAKILNKIDAYLWLYNDDCGRQHSHIEYKCFYAICYFDSFVAVYHLRVAHRRLLPLCRCYAVCFRSNKTTLSRRLGARRRLC